MTDLANLTGDRIVAGLQQHEFSATSVLESCLTRIDQQNSTLNCFTTLTVDRAQRRAEAIDRALARDKPVGPLAGVPFGVKNLFDIQGITTVAGSKIHRDQPAALTDSPLITRLERAGAILVGAQNMDEYAYGFTTENSHDGPTRNPRDIHCMAGGSSGGSAAAVAAGLVPLSLGSDTNGSIRVPSSFCGIFGLKPTFGRLSRRGTVGFVDSLDHLGPFARNVSDLALVYDALQGYDRRDPAQARRSIEPVRPELERGIDGLRIAILDGWFRDNASAEVLDCLHEVSLAVGAIRHVTWNNADRARAAAYCMTAIEGANRHLDDLRQRPFDFDPATRDRFLAGALLPAQILQQAQRFRRWFYEQVMAQFQNFDVFLAPCTPVTALPLGTKTMMVQGRELPARPNIGLYTQPISFIGLPVVAAPIVRDRALPIGIQIIAPPWREDLALRVAAWLERAGIAAAPIPSWITSHAHQ